MTAPQPTWPAVYRRHLLDMQVSATLRLPGGTTISAVRHLPDLAPVAFEREDDALRLHLPDVGTLTMLAVDLA